MCSTRDAWKSAPAASRLATAAIAFLILLGVYLRVRFNGTPDVYTMDEELFAKNVHNYLLGRPDNNDHPPLGKLLLTPGVMLWGYNSVGWRFMALVFGLQSIVLSFYVAKALFRDSRAGWYAAAFFASDGVFIAYSRSGLLDGILVCSILWTVLAATSSRGTRGVLLCGALTGMAISIKWSAVTVGIPVMMTLILLGNATWWSLLWLGIAPIVHLLVWMWGLYLAGQDFRPAATLRLMADLYRHHQDMAKHTNALTSPWYSWPVFYHPIALKVSLHGWTKRLAIALPNLVLGFTTTVLVVILPLWLWIKRTWKIQGGILSRRFDETFIVAVAILLLGWFAALAPWMVARGGYTFFYHYMPSYAFVLLLLAGLCAKTEQAYPKILVGWLAAVVATALIYAPIWGELPVTHAGANWRLFLKSWRP